ncbi:hypothetical protein [Rhizobium sp. 2MFCol3.1]|uniref:hypothetical protein n=1 Tax=Rhizobium sp. 2MFCol3.1 TaxID=1246459 RepID=UPI00035FF730|nr:hypothetical protein [Rhizobium sp. 2MFCol3.1]
MTNGSKCEGPMKALAAPVLQPVSRGEIESFFQSVGAGFVSDVQLGVGSTQADAGDRCVKQVHEMDEYVLNFIRVLREIDTCFNRRTFEPLSIVKKIDRKGA